MVAGMLPDVLTFRSTDLAVSRLTGYGIPWVIMVDSRATTGFQACSASATSGWMSIRAFFLRAAVKEERPRFEARLSMTLAEGGRRRRVKANRSPGASCPHLTFVDDAASFPLNRPATTTTEDTAPDDGFEFTILLVCVVRSRRVFPHLPPPHPMYLTSPQGIHDCSNPALLALNARNIVDKRVPAPFALISNPLAYSRKSAVVLGESGSTVPTNSHSHLSPPGLFQPPLAGVKPVADVGGRLVGKSPAILESGVHYHRMSFKSGRCATVGASREESG